MQTPTFILPAVLSFSPCNGCFSVLDFPSIGSPLSSLCGGDLTASVKWQAGYKSKIKLWHGASAKQAGVSTPLFIVCSDQLKSTTNTQLNLRKSLIISVPQPWECSLCHWQRFICTVMVSGAAPEHVRPGLWFLWLLELTSHVRAGRRRQSWCTDLAGSSLWVPSVLPWCVPLGTMSHKYYTSLWMAWLTAGCSWASVLGRMIAT